MGFFSGITSAIFGGGSSSTQTSTQKTAVDNNVTVNFDVDKLAETMENNTLMDIFFKSELAVKELSIKEKEQKTKADALKVSAMALQQQIKTDNNILSLTVISIVLAIIGLFYKNIKGKK